MTKEEEMKSMVLDMVNRNLGKIYGLWEELGIDTTGQHNRNQTVINHLNALMEKMISEEMTAKKKILDSLELHTKQAMRLGKELGVSFEYPDSSLVLVQYERAMRHESERLMKMKEARLAEVKTLREVDEALCQRLEMDPFYISTTDVPTTTQLNGIKGHIKNLEEIKKNRLNEFEQMKKTMLKLYDELEIEPMTEIEREIACEDTDQFILSSKNMDHVTRILGELVEKVKHNQKQIMDCVDKMDSLYERLQLNLKDKFEFLARNQGHSSTVIIAMNAEIERLEEIKRANIEKFIVNIRNELHQLWDQCFWSEDQRNQFSGLHSTWFTEALLESHEEEVRKMKEYFNDNKGLLMKVADWYEVWNKFKELERRAKDPSRLMKARGNALILEEKERNKVNRMLPRLEQELHTLISDWEKENCKTFLVRGVNFSEYIDQQKEEHISQLEAEKLARDQAKKKTLLQESKFGARPSTPAKLKVSSASSGSGSSIKTPMNKINKMTPGSSRILGRINTGLAAIRSPRSKTKNGDSVLKRKRRSSGGMNKKDKKEAKMQAEKIKRAALSDLDDSIVQTRSKGTENVDVVENYAKFKNGNLLNSTESENRLMGGGPHYLTPTKSVKNQLFKTPNSPFSRAQSRMKRTPGSATSIKSLPALI